MTVSLRGAPQPALMHEGRAASRSLARVCGVPRAFARASAGLRFGDLDEQPTVPLMGTREKSDPVLFRELGGFDGSRLLFRIAVRVPDKGGKLRGYLPRVHSVPQVA